jgi:hypothetical protein
MGTVRTFDAGGLRRGSDDYCPNLELELASQQIRKNDPMTGPPCEHEWIEVGKRRWCVRRYDQGGCGSFQVMRAGKWIEERLETPKPEPEPELFP